MHKNHKNKITKQTIPEGFSVSLALVDLLPVLFFGLSAIRIGSLFSSTCFMLGAGICLISGIVKVLWKLAAAVSGKNIWGMFVQMRILMPAGFLVMLAALFLDRGHLNGSAVLTGLSSFPACIFFGLGVLDMILMTVFAFRLDSCDPRANWLEQGVNGIAQACFFVGLLLV